MRAAALTALALVLVACSTSPAPTAATSQGPATDGRTGPLISAPPITPPSPPGDNTQLFTCTDATGGTPGTSAFTDVRVTHEPGFDRFVIQFDGVYVPAFTVKRQAKPVFTQGGTGQAITLSGTSGVLVQLKSTSESTAYTGPADFTQAGFPIIKEVRLTDSSAGVVQWGLGLGSAACMRVFTATTPPARLIIDFATASS